MSHTCDKQTSTTTTVVDDNANASADAPSWTEAAESKEKWGGVREGAHGERGSASL